MLLEGGGIDEGEGLHLLESWVHYYLTITLTLKESGKKGLDVTAHIEKKFH